MIFQVTICMLILTMFLWIRGEPNYPGITPVSVSSTEYPTEGYDFGYDKVVYWKVDESINGSSADSPSTVAGTWWKFFTESSFPEIITQAAGCHCYGR